MLYPGLIPEKVQGFFFLVPESDGKDSVEFFYKAFSFPKIPLEDHFCIAGSGKNRSLPLQFSPEGFHIIDFSVKGNGTGFFSGSSCHRLSAPFQVDNRKPYMGKTTHILQKRYFIIQDYTS